MLVFLQIRLAVDPSMVIWHHALHAYCRVPRRSGEAHQAQCLALLLPLSSLEKRFWQDQKTISAAGLGANPDIGRRQDLSMLNTFANPTGPRLRCANGDTL